MNRNRYVANQNMYLNIPGNPIAFWVGDAFINSYVVGKPMGTFVSAKQGLATADNDKFLRLWYEVEIDDVAIKEKTATELTNSLKWIPYNKGGEKRNWYGNYDYVVNWQNNGYEIKHNFDKSGKLRSRPQNTDTYLKEAMTWNDITTGGFSIRYREKGSIHDITGMSAFCSDIEKLKLLLGLMSTKLANYYFKVLNPTIHLQIGNFINFPVLDFQGNEELIVAKVDESILIAKDDWDSFETSWDFKKHPLV